ncbi:MAG: TatD family hydrolase [Rhodobacteraceae bacterium]|nr:TatD family hydrolase [Paracoccaceae bacterium]MCY4196217.1 TatD family hydrolase [Paracoccaceae bacterium]
MFSKRAYTGTRVSLKAQSPLFDELLPHARYVGEIGLDGALEFRKSWQDQCNVFENTLRSCEDAGGRIMSIHSRRAASAVLERIESSPRSGTPVLHWFSGSNKELDRAVDCDCWFSVGPAMLAGERGRKLVSQMPRERVLTETDGPFAIFESHSLFPWDVAVAETGLAELWQIGRDDVRCILHENLSRLTKQAASSRTPM